MNRTEAGMGRRRTAGEESERRAQWVARLSRFEKDGRTVASFCAAEAVSVWSFYTWRKKLAAARTERPKAAGLTAMAAAGGGFIDAGVARMTARGPDLPRALSAAGVELQIDLGGGVLLRVVRR
jgi:hypothetical protein